MRIPTKIAAGGLVGLVLPLGSGIAHADSSHEKEACQPMDDPAGPESGYAPAEYAFHLYATACVGSRKCAQSSHRCLKAVMKTIATRRAGFDGQLVRDRSRREHMKRSNCLHTLRQTLWAPRLRR